MQITEVNRKNNSNEDTVDICENNFPPEFEAGAMVAIAWPNVFSIGVALSGAMSNEDKKILIEEWAKKENDTYKKRMILIKRE